MRLSTILLACITTIAFGQTSLDKTMVVINGQAISAKTYFKRMEVLPNVGQVVNDKFVQASPGYLTLNKLITETLLLQLAKEKGVSPTQAEIDVAIKERTTENPNLVENLNKIGYTIDDLKYDTTVLLAEYKLQTMGVNITDFEVEKFYKENPGSYTMPKRYKLSVVAVDSDEKKRAVDEALNSGKTFGAVAKELSLDLSRVNEGKLGEIPESALQTDTQAAVKSTKKGSITDWLSNGELFVKFYVEDVLDQKLIALDATLKGEIRRNLTLDRGRVKNDLSKMMEDMRTRAKIEFQGSIFDEQLKQGFKKG